MPETPPNKPTRAKRPFLGITFECCNVYQRVYLNKDRTAFVGGCPKCGKRLTVKVDPNGERGRFFSAR
ncbi:hypothetical protein FJZ36_17565 [Candidatus Poribacteria bacterium]|nr:hypothetical protein [Candidatus Poribacteria bacterium]